MSGNAKGALATHKERPRPPRWPLEELEPAPLAPRKTLPPATSFHYILQDGVIICPGNGTVSPDLQELATATRD